MKMIKSTIDTSAHALTLSFAFFIGIFKGVILKKAEYTI